MEDVAAGGKNLSITPALVSPPCTCGIMLIAPRFEDDFADILHSGDDIHGEFFFNDDSSLII